MKVRDLEEDLQFLAQVLQEQLRAEVPSGEFFQVKCAVKNDQLMILTQHPLGVVADTEKTFAVLEEALQSLPAHQERRVELFLRVVGVKLPYAKRYLSLSTEADGELGVPSGVMEQVARLAESHPPNPPIGEAFDPLADAPDLSDSSTSKPALQVKTIQVGAAFGVIAALLGAYFLTRPCVMFECKEIQTAKQLQRSFRQLAHSPKSEQELPHVQQQFEKASASVKTIPPWSPRYREAEQLSVSLFVQSEKINQVSRAFDMGSQAAQKSQTPAKSYQELEARQQLWRVAIAPLEGISPNNELYGLAQPKLLLYRTSLQYVKQQLLTEEKWLKKLGIAKAVAITATKREVAAKSLADLQKVQYTWQLAVNALTAIPRNSLRYQEAQKLLAEYKPFLATARERATIELLAAKTYNQAVNAASLAKRYEQQNQWQAAVAHWDQALRATKQIAKDSLYYSQAQLLIEPYSNAAKQAQEKLQVASLFQKTRTDLDKICYGAIRVCNYTVDKLEIRAALTLEYEQMLQSNLMTVSDQGDPKTVARVTNHFESLQQALEVISENANLPVVVYNVQGNAIHAYTPAALKNY